MPIKPSANETPNALLGAAEYFDELYRNVGASRYWWRHDDPYATDPDAYPYSLLTQMTLRLIRNCPPGRALDLGAGEGADSVRLARLGYAVTAVEVSSAAAERIQRFADLAGVRLAVELADINYYEPNGQFDVVICNGILHYIENKVSVIETMQEATREGGLNVISAWSKYTPVPDCHTRVAIFCDDEDGIIAKSYAPWETEFLYFERNRPDSAHGEMPPHSHSHIKLIARRPVGARLAHQAGSETTHHDEFDARPPGTARSAHGQRAQGGTQADRRAHGGGGWVA